MNRHTHIQLNTNDKVKRLWQNGGTNPRDSQPKEEILPHTESTPKRLPREHN